MLIFYSVCAQCVVVVFRKRQTLTSLTACISGVTPLLSAKFDEAPFCSRNLVRPKSLWWIADIKGVIEPQFSRGLKKSGAYSAIVISNKGVVDTGTWYTKSRLDPASTSNLIQSLQNK